MYGCLPSLPNVPGVESARLRLRGHGVDDFANTFALWSDAAVVPFLGGRSFNREECWARFLRYIGHWAALGFGYWVVEEKATGSFVGEVGFGDNKRDMTPALGPIPELGWVLATAHHGKGYATEAALAAISWGRAHFSTPEMACIVHPDHLASIRVATRCGFREEARGVFREKPTIVFKLT